MQILLIDDNPDDVLLASEALRQTGIAHVLSVAPNGRRAVALLRREGEFAGAARPALILIGLRTRATEGREVLAAVGADPLLQSIPVVALTASRTGSDVVESYRLYASCHVVKPVHLGQLVQAIAAIDRVEEGATPFPARAGRPSRRE